MGSVLSLKPLARTRKVWRPAETFSSVRLPSASVTPRLTSSSQTVALDSVRTMIDLVEDEREAGFFFFCANASGALTESKSTATAAM
jgi:hypothetical protein